MIKKIICPTDFSDTSANAVEYAARLAQILKAEMLFVNVQRVRPVSSAVSMGEGIGATQKTNAAVAQVKLKELCELTHKTFKVKAFYEVDITTRSLAGILSAYKSNNVIIVMGTNGADDLYQYFFGTNAYQVIKKSRCPVLTVPSNSGFGSIKKIVYAWDYSTKRKFSFTVAADFIKAFDPHFVFLHVSKQRTASNREVFKSLQNEIISLLGDKLNIEFKQIFSDDIPEGINKYMIKSKAGLLAINFNNRPLGTIFHTSVTKELSATASFPILVLHA